MTWAGVALLFVLIWPVVFFLLLPIRIRSQSEDGNVVAGTPPSAPVYTGLRWKWLLVTGITVVLWGLFILAVEWEWITLADIGVKYSG